MIKNFIFDLGGVIILHDSAHNEETLASIFSIPLTQATELWHKHSALLMIGQETSHQFLERVKAEVASDADTEKLYSHWLQEYAKYAQNLNQRVLDLITTLSGYYNLYMLTDTIDVHDDYNSGRGIYNRFKRVYKSFEMGLRKPDERIFLEVLKETDSEASETVFIDDLPKNVEAAQALGMQTVCFQDTDQLITDLKTLGVEI